MTKQIPNLSMIIARDLNGNIGKWNKIPWDCKSDMQWFKGITADKGLIVGRKTFDGLPDAVKKRCVIVLSRGDDVIIGDFGEVHLDFQEAISFCAETCAWDGDMMVIGGAQIYRQFMPYVSKIYLSTIMTVIDDADTNFIDFAGDWKVVESVAHDDCVLTTLERV